MEHDKNSKHQTIVKSKTIVEEVMFRGKKITRERVIKEFKIPKIITSDIGFQLQFGYKGNDKSYKSPSNQNTINFDDKKVLI